MQELTIGQLRECFKPYDIRYHPEKYHLEYPSGLLRKASVLIPLFYRDGDYRVILTVRSKDLTHHAGYVAFPGGMQDDSDEDEIHTALREAEEEIGLDPKTVQIIAICFPSITRPNSLAYPVIGLVPSDFKTKMNEKEVTAVFDLPLSRFLTKDRLTIQDLSDTTGIIYHMHHFIDTVNGEEVDTWGFTAGICIHTAIVLYQSDLVFNMLSNFQLDRNNVFSADATRSIIARMTNTRAKY